MSDEQKNIPPVKIMPGPGGGNRGFRGKPVEKPKALMPTLKRLWNYLSIHKLKLILIVALVVFTTLSSLFGTKIIGTAIDDYILLGRFDELYKVLSLLLVVYLLASLFTWAQTQLSVNLAQNTVYSIRKELFDKLEHLPLKFFDTRSRGDIMSRVTNDIDNISNALNTSLSQVISSALTVSGILVFMLILSPLLTVVCLVTIPLLFFITKFITKHSRVFFKSQQKALGELNGKIEEAISGQKVIKVFVKEDEEIAAFNELNEQLRVVGIKAQIFSGLMGPSSTMVNSLSYALIAVIGAVANINIGVITSFLIYSRQFSRPFNEISMQYNNLLSAIAGAERVFEVMDQLPEPKDLEDAVTLDNIEGKVTFEGVDFSYNEGNPILKGINLYANPGQTIALVGPTGAGKTTIINLLTRFYDIQSGTISIDGINICNIKRDSLRSTLGIVLQDTYLFSGTIMENIRYGRLDATDEEVIKASTLANAHEFVRRLPNGYQTILSEDTDSLSQGQKQMLAIARAILADPKILILDEATSNVDTRTEVKIQAAMLNLMQGRTSFVIAHRLSTIRNADLIAVINNGEIIERGNHKELLTKKGFYYNLYINQFNEG